LDCCPFQPLHFLGLGWWIQFDRLEHSTSFRQQVAEHLGHVITA
jgi:hypothetical protein